MNRSPSGVVESYNRDELHTVEPVGPIAWIKETRAASFGGSGVYIQLAQAKRIVDNLRANGYMLVKITDK